MGITQTIFVQRPDSAILDENDPLSRMLGRKNGVVFNVFFGRGQTFEILTKKAGKTSGPDEKRNAYRHGNTL